jgi:hypothetical protein
MWPGVVRAGGGHVAVRSAAQFVKATNEIPLWKLQQVVVGLQANTCVGIGLDCSGTVGD